MSNEYLALVHKIAEYAKTVTISTDINRTENVPLKLNYMKIREKRKEKRCSQKW